MKTLAIQWCLFNKWGNLGEIYPFFWGKFILAETLVVEKSCLFPGFGFNRGLRVYLDVFTRICPTSNSKNFVHPSTSFYKSPYFWGIFLFFLNMCVSLETILATNKRKTLSTIDWTNELKHFRWFSSSDKFFEKILH